MKKLFTLLSLIALLAVGVFTLPSCKKKSSDNYTSLSGSYFGTLNDSLTFSAGNNGVPDTLIVTASGTTSGSTINVMDKNTGSTFSGTITAITNSGSVITSNVNFNGVLIKQGGTIGSYTTSTAFFTTDPTTYNIPSGVSIDLFDSYGTEFTFTGTMF